MQRLLDALTAIFKLGFFRSILYFNYRLSCRLGLYRWLTPLNPRDPKPLPILHIPWVLPTRAAYAGRMRGQEKLLLAEADEILAGEIRLFGNPPIPLELDPGPDLGHWLVHDSNQHHAEDVKFTWEPARFGWATVLARAYYLSGDERYPANFWDYFETFQAANPPNRGPNWASAQEVGLRLISWVFTYALIQESPHTTSERSAALAAAIGQHARRIPPTLGFARFQFNNHLLSETAALYTAALALPDHPRAGHWRKLGRNGFIKGLKRQIDRDGAYAQHSTNYTRIMLQLALWVNLLANSHVDPLPEETRAQVARALLWQHSLYDAESGQVANLGNNDGAYILPLTTRPFQDHTSVLSAVQRAFFPIPDFPADEMAFWLAPPAAAAEADLSAIPLHPHRVSGKHTWGYLRGPRFWNRPSHADVQHVDLWWKGLNIALDAGTYLYNGDPPWDHQLCGSSVHNVITVNGRDSMRRVSRFLFLDWPRTRMTDQGSDHLSAETNAYHRLGVNWIRTLARQTGQWTVIDQLQPAHVSLNKPDFDLRLHWLLPDWGYDLNGSTLTLKTADGPLKLVVNAGAYVPMRVSLARAGQLLSGQGPIAENRGWHSLSYDRLQPALSLAVHVNAALPITFTSTFHLPDA
jgi:hypothetical protein